MIGDIVKKIDAAYARRMGNIISLSNKKYDDYFISPWLNDAPELSAAEIKAIKSKWGRIIPYVSRGFDFYRGLKRLDDFNVNYLPSSYYFPIIENALNPINSKFHLSHKSLNQLLYGNIVKVPTTVLRSYHGIYLDNEYRALSMEETTNILKHVSEPLIFKPASNTVQGFGISKLGVNDLQDLAIKIQKSLPLNFPDFVLQKFVEQSSETKIFNPSSLNCFRITTLNLNGEISICSRALKCGSTDSIVDNIGTGKKGVAIGINYDGTLHQFGYYGNGEKSSSHNGIKFEGKRISSFNKVIEIAKQLHQVNPECKIIGWDLAIDNNNDIVLIESNAAHPGIAIEQIATGPIFGERTDEVIEFLSKEIK